ncbi:hypothetical protein [Moorella sp. Hama-1]|uniref:hypothetical protein n=1 Tax=Moorella sp. Hama-1 TaxID=2138101 RepID=UPI000D6476FB|nr:hypothetical protein [Moorella sp. Hama-1]
MRLQSFDPFTKSMPSRQIRASSTCAIISFSIVPASHKRNRRDLPGRRGQTAGPAEGQGGEAGFIDA